MKQQVNNGSSSHYEYDVFLSHDWGKNDTNHAAVSQLCTELKKRGIKTWFDEDSMPHNILDGMSDGISDSAMVIVFVTEEYMKKVAGKGEHGKDDNCRREFNFAVNSKGIERIIVVVNEQECSNTKTWYGPVGLILSQELYISNWNKDDSDTCVNKIVQNIHDFKDLSLADALRKGLTTENRDNVLSSRSGSAGSNHNSFSSATTTSDTDGGDDVTIELMTYINSQIEELDKRGKTLFKEKKYMEAADFFSEAMDLIHAEVKDLTKHDDLNREVMTLLNNRSAMYEKGGVPYFALIDCDEILKLDKTHIKARTRKLRIFESLNRHPEALVEACALQLNFVEDNRDKNLRLGIPIKIEQLVEFILPDQIERMLEEMKATYLDCGSLKRPLPSSHTILQYLQSYSDYNVWMAKAAKDGSVDSLTVQLNKVEDEKEKIDMLLRRGRKYAYQRKFHECENDFESAFAIMENNEFDKVKSLVIGSDLYTKVLEWVGMFRHLRYDLDGALKCYETCKEFEPANVEILVKYAGVKIDYGKLEEEAMELYKTALGLDPSSVDVLLHRSNSYMLQQQPKEAKKDLELCVVLRPDHQLTRLHLARVYLAMEDLDGAQHHLDKAAEIDPDSSELHSCKGELLCQKGDFIEAKAEFDLAIECDAGNPTPYAKAALAVMNTLSTSGAPPGDMMEPICLLEKAIEVDPHFHDAYVHLGKLKLSITADLTTAKEVVNLFDKGMEYCHTADEMKGIMSMRILTVALMDAAAMLNINEFGDCFTN